jgi:hypothetical protein
MRRTAAIFLVVLLVVALASCAKIKFGILAEQETVIIPLRYDEATRKCKLEQRMPPEIRTRPGRLVTWVVVGGICEGHKIAITPEATAAGENAFEGPTELSGTIPGKDAVLRLTARVRGTVLKRVFRYRLLIDAEPAEYNPPAEQGLLFVCPVWPCGGFKF